MAQLMRPDYHVQALEWANKYGGIVRFSLGGQHIVRGRSGAAGAGARGRGSGKGGPPAAARARGRPGPQGERSHPPPPHQPSRQVLVSDPQLAATILGRSAGSLPRKCIGYAYFDLVEGAGRGGGGLQGGTERAAQTVVGPGLGGSVCGGGAAGRC
jgi:hypothetical protein